MRRQNYCHRTFHWKNFCMNDTCGVTLIECCGDTRCDCGLCCSMRGTVMELGVFHTRIWLTSTPGWRQQGPRVMLQRKVKLFLTPSPSYPVGEKEQLKTHLSTRSLCRAVDGQAAMCQGELGSAALPVPSAVPESRAGSSSLSCTSHFRHTGRRRNGLGLWDWQLKN